MSLPSGYKRLEYIQSSGTQYIDMGFKATQNTKIEAKFHNEQSANSAVFGADKAWTQDAFGIWINNTIAVPVVGTVSGTIEVSYSSTYDTFTLDKNTLKLNGGTIWTASGVSAFQTPTNVCLGAVNRSGNVSEKFVGKMYYCKVWENGTLIRDFIPCQTRAGDVGMWDDVNSVFYVNAGTGTFTAGPVIAISVALSDIRELEYIESSGTQFIDTGVVPKNNTRVDVDCDITYGTDWIMILGSYDTNKYFSWWANGATIYAYYGTSNKNVAGENRKQTLSANKNIWTAGNSAMSFSEVSFTANSSIYLFSVNNGGNYSKASMKLYSCRIYDNGTLIRDYIAAKLADGTVGLYDKLNGLFYINAGTGTFTAGPVVASPSIFVNIDGIWKPINHIYVNINNIWQKST